MTIMTDRSVTFHVQQELSRGGVTLPTEVTEKVLEQLVDIRYRMMLPDMITETVVTTEGFLTELAGEIFLVFLIVSPRVLYQIFPLGENLATDFTSVFLAWRRLLVSPVALHGHPVAAAPPALEPVLHAVL